MKKLPLSLIALSSLSMTFYACKPEKTTGESKRSLQLANIDSSVQPGDNFFLYANGKWLKTATIPPTEARVGSSLEMYNRTKANIKTILEEAAASKAAAGSVDQKVGDFYASGLDSATIEKRGYDPVKPYLQQINAITDVNGIMKFEADQQRMGNGSLIGQYVGSDEKNSAVNIAVYVQSGLGLPDRDYYFKTDPSTQAVVKAYQTYLTKLFTLTGDDTTTASKNTTIVYNIEKQLAGSHRTNVELRDPESNYHKLAVAQLDQQMPVFGWKALLNNLNVHTDSVNVSQPGYYTKLNDLLKTIPINDWKVYMRAHLLNNTATALSNNFVMADFDYAGKALTGQQQIKERWERVYKAVDGNIGEALGELYVKRFFTEDAKKRMLDLVNNLQTAFEGRINKLDWMSDSTKVKAKEKLHAFIKKIGFPDKWRDYGKVSVARDKYFENLVSASENEYNYQIAKVGKPVDRKEWGMTPPTINAYYNPTFNEIVFPAGILQYPYFDPTADDAMNYGGIGMIIGHEMTHGFDDQGAQYDKDGNLKNWWSKEDNEKFKAKGKSVAALYSTFTVLDSLHVNGELTLGENIADIGGIAIAYDAFKLTSQGKDTVKIDGLTPDQRFFLSYAQGWRSKMKDEMVRQRINTDPHSPAMYRVMGPLMNFTPFYNAFNVKEGQWMYKPEAERIKIW
jgi:putative endopeptidase